MLYASTRASLVKGLGASLFTDSIFATSKEDLTPDAYRAHKRHQAAPKPLSSREQELTDLRIAENTAATYEGSRARASHVGNPVGYQWSDDAQQAVSKLVEGEGCTLLILVRYSLEYGRVVCLMCLHLDYQSVYRDSGAALFV